MEYPEQTGSYNGGMLFEVLMREHVTCFNFHDLKEPDWNRYFDFY
jgi:hypothetical protein